jgi:3-deoxy-D-manno-octulosonate cytidylyltransferase
MPSLLISDVDGVLTDGCLNIGKSGELFKSFNVKDGYGIQSWIDSGREFVIITSRSSKAVEKRAAELNIGEVYQGVSNKAEKIIDIAKQKGISVKHVGYVGDDTTDLEALKTVGYSCCPSDAVKVIREECDYVSNREGGKGAIRDVIEYFLNDHQTVLGVIPARHNSTRLPGKPLVELCGKPMIQHVYERTSEAEGLDEIIVATDDSRIIDAIEQIGGKAILTDPKHPTGTDRVAEIARTEAPDITVNIQGDEPLIDPNVIDAVVSAVKYDDPPVATPIAKIEDESLLGNENTVKVVCDDAGRALYFSRSRIPSNGSIGETYKHIGLYGFETDLLLEYVKMGSTLEDQEDLEQLRLLENGYDIQTVEVGYDSKEINVPEDVDKVEKIMRGNNDV